MSYTPDEAAEIAHLTGWHLGTTRPAIMPPPRGTELVGWWYDANGNAAGGRILVADINNVNFTRADILLI